MTKHLVKVKTGLTLAPFGRIYRASCKCGWKGQAEVSYMQAQSDTHRHVMSVPIESVEK
jgi:hypothetical protein